MQNTHDLLVGTLLIGIPSFQFEVSFEWSHHKRFCLRTQQLEQPSQTPSFTLRAKL